MSSRKLLTRRELAAHFQVNPQTVGKWERSGMPIAELGRPGKPSLFSIAETNRWLKAREKAAKTETVDLVKERARKERAQALVQEQMLAIRAGELVRREDVENAWSTEIAAVRAKLLSWPATLSDTLHRAAELGGRSAGARNIEKILTTEVENLLLELANPNAPRRSGPKAPPAKKKPTRRASSTKKKPAKKKPAKKKPAKKSASRKN